MDKLFSLISESGVFAQLNSYHLLVILVIFVLFQFLIKRLSILSSSLKKNPELFASLVKGRIPTNYAGMSPAEQKSLHDSEVNLRSQRDKFIFQFALCVLVATLIVVLVLIIVPVIMGNRPLDKEPATDRFKATTEDVRGVQGHEASTALVGGGADKIGFVVRALEGDKENKYSAGIREAEYSVMIIDDETGTRSRPTIDNGIYIADSDVKNSTFEIYKADSGAGNLIRDVKVNGYIWKQRPCPDRTFYVDEGLRNRSYSEDDVEGMIANFPSGAEIKCAIVDKNLVIWEDMERKNETSQIDRGGVYIPRRVMAENIDSFDVKIRYNVARARYNACLELGYPDSCSAAKAAFAKFSNNFLLSANVSPDEAQRVDLDIRSMHIQIKYAEMREMIAKAEYELANTAIDGMLADFQENGDAYKNVKLPESRLRVDAAFSAFSYAKQLEGEKADASKYCMYYKIAQTHASKALWPAWRRKHLPEIVARLENCRSRGIGGP